MALTAHSGFCIAGFRQLLMAAFALKMKSVYQWNGIGPSRCRVAFRAALSVAARIHTVIIILVVASQTLNFFGMHFMFEADKRSLMPAELA